MNRRDAEFTAMVAALCFLVAALLLWAGIAWPAMLSGYSGGGGGSASITPNSCTLPNVATGIDASGTLTCTQPSNVTGNAATATLATAATALAADPANCTNANEFARGVLASGVAECAQPAFSNLSGTAAVTQGGTGLTTVAQGAILYASPADTLVALPKDTNASRYLANTGTSNNPAWAQVNLANGVSGTLPVGNGGTGVTTFSEAGRVVFSTGATTLAGLATPAPASTPAYLQYTSGSTPGWAKVRLADGVTGNLPLANLTDDGTASKCLLSGGAGGDPAWGTCASSSLIDVQYYTSGSNNWTKPANAKTVHVWCIGGGGGGGSGRRGTTNASGGGGAGGSGAIAEAWFVAADLPSSPSTVTVTIGASVSGGAAAGALGAENGAAGTNGNATTFGSYLSAAGGSRGEGGISTGGSGGAGGTASPWLGRSGGSSLTGAGTNSQGCTGSTAFGAHMMSPGGGGSGGGGSSTAVNAGGDGGDACVSGTAKGAGGTTSYGTAGGNGTNASANTKFGGGGGGGGAGGNASINGGAGGNGGAPGGGGGGGGGCVSGGAGCTSGLGGTGAAGGCVVESYG